VSVFLASFVEQISEVAGPVMEWSGRRRKEKTQ